MNLAVTTQNRYYRTQDGRFWTSTGMAFKFWTRYLDVFEKVFVIARVKNVSVQPPGAVRADGERVEIIALPYFLGPWEMLLHWQELLRAYKRINLRNCAVILRVPAQLTSLWRRRLAELKLPWAVEVIADPWEQFGPGVHHTPIMPLLRIIARIDMRIDCRSAVAAAYVTETTLQRRYPCPNGMFAVSDVDLDEDAFVQTPKIFPRGSSARRWILAGSLHHGQKGVDIILQSIYMLNKAGFCKDVHLTVVGDGPERKKLKESAQKLDLADRVEFIGALPSSLEVRESMKSNDLFVLPSRSEGLPRAMLEAMACGLPCIGTKVGGVSEILPPEALAEASDAADLARVLKEISNNSFKLNKLAAENLETAQKFKKSVLRPKLRAFLEKVRDASTLSAF